MLDYLDSPAGHKLIESHKSNLYSADLKLSTGPVYSPTILQNSLVLKSFLYLVAFECNTTSDWLNPTVKPIRSCITFKFTKSWRDKQRMFFRMIGEYGPRFQSVKWDFIYRI